MAPALRFAFVLLAVGTLIGAPAQRIDGPRTFAVLVGVGECADKAIKPRPTAEKDMVALHRLLSDPARGGVGPKDAHLLVGKKATKANFLTALRRVSRDAKPADLVLVAIVGQGAPLGRLGERRCYFMADSTFAGRDDDAVASDEIEEALGGLRAKRIAAFIDVDFTGFVSKEPIPEPSFGAAPYKEFVGEGIGYTEEFSEEKFRPLPGRVAFVSTDGLRPSPDLDGHGVFTKTLLEALGGKADHEGGGEDGFVTVNEVTRYMTIRLRTLAKGQFPVFFIGPSSHFALTSNPDTVMVHKRLAAFEQKIREGDLDAKIVAEGRSYLARMPRLKQRREARKLYQDFADGNSSAKQLRERRAKLSASMKLRPERATVFADGVLGMTALMKKKYIRDVNEGRMVRYAITGLYDLAEEEIPTRIAARLKEAAGLESVALRALAIDARAALGQREDLDDLNDINSAIRGMLGELDPLARYTDPDSKDPILCHLLGNNDFGIGIRFRREVASRELLIVTVIDQSPAHLKGLQLGDVITEIVREVDRDGKPLPRPEKTPTRGLEVKKAIGLILGTAGTSIRLMIRRQGVKEPFALDVERGKVERHSIFGHRRKVAGGEDFTGPLPK